MGQRLVILDAGHSGRMEPGAVNRLSGLKEADVNLDITLRLASKLSQKSIPTILTRCGDIDNDGLTWRADVANETRADLFISLHCNAADNPAAEGYEVWTSPGETLSDTCATKIFYAIRKAFPGMDGRADYCDGDVDKESKFTVLTATNCPAVLVEMGFISNINEAAMLATVTFSDTMAQALADAIEEYFALLP